MVELFLPLAGRARPEQRCGCKCWHVAIPMTFPGVSSRFMFFGAIVFGEEKQRDCDLTRRLGVAAQAGLKPRQWIWAIGRLEIALGPRS